MSSNIGKSAAVLTASKLLTTMITLATSMLLSRFRTLEEYGTYSQITLVISLAISACMLGLPNCTNYFLARAATHEDRRKFLSVYYTLSTLLGFFVGIILVVSVPLVIKYFNNPAIAALWYILAVIPWTRVIIDSIGNVLVVYQKSQKLMIVNIVNACIALASVLIVQLMGWSFREYMLLYMLGEMGVTLWIYSIVWKLEDRISVALSKEMVISILKYSLPLGLSALLGTITVEIDKLMISGLFDTASMAVYTNAAKELPVTVVATSLTAVVLPQISKLARQNKITEGIHLWGRTIELSFIIMSFIVTTLLVFAPQIITLLYSEKYTAGVSTFRIYSLVLILRTTYFGMFLSAMGRTKTVMYSSAATLCINAALNYICYLLIGFSGPAAATFISIFAAAAIQLIKTSKLCQIPLSKIWPWKKLMKHTGINLCWGTAAAFLMKYYRVGTSNLEIVLCIVAGMGIVLVYLLVEKNTIKMLWTELNKEG